MRSYFIVFTLVLSINLFSQNNIGIGTTTPNSSAMLDITSTDKGLLIPRVTLNDASTAAPVTSPAEGLLIYNYNGTEPHGFWYWDGTQWVQVGSGSGTGGTLDDAYNYGGNGAGRIINADYGAVQINLSTTTGGTEGLSVISSAGTSGIPTSSIYAENSAYGGGIYSITNNAANPYNSIEGSSNSNNQYTSAVAGYYDGTGQGVGVYGNVYNAGSSGVSGVMGVNNRTNGGYGVYGSGFNGCVGETNYAAGVGIWGQNYYASGSGSGCGVVGDGNYGVWGQTTYGPSGVFGLNTRTDGGHGVWGQGFNGVVGESTQINGYGVWGSNSATTDPGIGVAGIGVTGIAGQSTNLSLSYGVYSFDDAGIFNQLDVGGNFWAGGTKSFVIDHPMDPDNKLLLHYCIESPEVLNMYRGTVTLDNNGEATVVLPDYFDKINKNFSYHLTPVGASAPDLFIKQEINNNSFVIAGGKPNMKVSWVVYSERYDEYIKNNPESAKSEITKKGRYEGKYIHPEFYGKSREYSIFPSNGLKQMNKQNSYLEKSKEIDINKLNNKRMTK
ncbi:MAG: hypothetical protein Kow0068_03570 [Marinilabiliales bacterium]